MIDTQVWVGILVTTFLLYLLKWYVLRKRKVKIYRISRESLHRSKDVLMAVLPLVEDESDHPLDESMLPYSKEDIKSAAKILAYYFWRKRRHEDLQRIKHCFVAISRFQNPKHDLEAQARAATWERNRLERELNLYMTHSPFSVNRHTK
ncbi:hypothetical protein GO013_09540 [Pseudodesulfovibrio sp. JC047]|uniref:hypothetical protein n=1 Tax=Pseudodesulfovibrio sp. JC047 TaxID=2683199 RepID=UPI0013D57B9C|nr:hypothetical protein [Pseudodesulfovibrio sp. JC047]NDV19660.1 hypothetical protein [Pseudodesulfovibrio sp. JC047]